MTDFHVWMLSLEPSTPAVDLIPASAESATGSEESSGEASTGSAVKDALVHHAVGIDDDAVSDAEAHDFAEDLGLLDGPVAAPLAAAVAVPVDVPPDPIADAALAAAPARASCIQLAEVNRHAKTKCMICDTPVMNGTIRFKYHLSKSSLKYMHYTCCDRIPVARSPHSRVVLLHQKEFDLGAHGDAVALGAAIDAAFPSLP